MWVWEGYCGCLFCIMHDYVWVYGSLFHSEMTYFSHRLRHCCENNAIFHNKQHGDGIDVVTYVLYIFTLPLSDSDITWTFSWKWHVIVKTTFTMSYFWPTTWPGFCTTNTLSYKKKIILCNCYITLKPVPVIFGTIVSPFVG